MFCNLENEIPQTLIEGLGLFALLHTNKYFSTFSVAQCNLAVTSLKDFSSFPKLSNSSKCKKNYIEDATMVFFVCFCFLMTNAVS